MCLREDLSSWNVGWTSVWICLLHTSCSLLWGTLKIVCLVSILPSLAACWCLYFLSLNWCWIHKFVCCFPIPEQVWYSVNIHNTFKDSPSTPLGACTRTQQWGGGVCGGDSRSFGVVSEPVEEICRWGIPSHSWVDPPRSWMLFTHPLPTPQSCSTSVF